MDHQNPQNELYSKFSFEPCIKTAQAFLYFRTGNITQKLLYQLKYNGKKELGVLLGRWFSFQLENTEVDFIVPVPLHPTKQRKRGYNQSEEIGKGIGELLHVPVRKELVRRVVPTQTQTRKSKLERWVNMENVYAPVRECLDGRSVLVVDDVVTTGATTGMLCDRLVDAGVKEIHIACIARGQ